jgi:hypothetical protein
MNNAIKPYLKPSFLICTVFLLIAGSSKSLIIEKLGIITTKLPLPLQKPLEEMDFGAIAPYKLDFQQRIDNHDIIEELGTEDYLQCVIIDTEAPESSPTRYCSLFITYYTGDPDTVPHVPDECYVGGGNKQVGKELLDLEIRNPIDDGQSESETVGLKASRVVFKRKNSGLWDTGSTFSKLYFFKVNGQYAGGKTATRAIMATNVFNKYSYFSKVEWDFYGKSNNSRILPEKEAIVSASEKMLSAVMPVLERDHWPDFDAANAEKNKK